MHEIASFHSRYEKTIIIIIMLSLKFYKVQIK